MEARRRPSRSVAHGAGPHARHLRISAADETGPVGERADERHRIAFYSHDTQGLGHVRRNSLLAASVVATRPDVSVLLLSGAPEAIALPLPPHTGVVVVPSLAKDADGRYRPKSLRCSLEELMSIRSAVLRAALLSFAPDLLVVDKVPRGVLGELDGALRRVRHEQGTRIVLGLRDVLDDAETTNVEWKAAGTTEAIRTLYDQVWVYGDPHVFDPAEEYGWPAGVRSKIAYTGYLGHGRTKLLSRAPPMPSAKVASAKVDARSVLCLVGGGQDGELLARSFAAAAFPAGYQGVLVTGPYFPDPVYRELRATERARSNFRLLGFVGNVPELVASCAATVSMAGYNAVCELLSVERPALLVPRTTPRREQAVRAERLAGLGLVDAIDVGSLGPAVLSAWLADAVARPPRSTASVDLDGLRRVPELVADLLDLDDRRVMAGAHVDI